MAKKNKKIAPPDDFDVLRAIRWCWDRGIYFYPVPISGTGSYKYPHKCRIELKQNGKKRLGTEEFYQNETLYDKIRLLYLNRYNKSNNKCSCPIPEFRQKVSENGIIGYCILCNRDK